MGLFKVWGLVVALIGAGQANADILRPLDAAATARLVVKAINEIEPARGASFGSGIIRIGDRHVTLSVKVAGHMPMLVDVNDLHEQLKAAPNGKQREDILLAFVRLQLDRAHGLESGRLIRTIETLSDFDTDNLLPVLSNRYKDGQAELISNVHEEFSVGLFIVWAEDRTTRLPQLVEKYGRAGAPLSPWLAKRIGLDRFELRKLGHANLKARLGSVTETRDGPFLTLSLNGRFGSSLLLLPDYWAEMAQGGQVLTAAVPRQDELIVIADATDAEIAELRQRVARIHGDSTDRTLLSAELFRWTGNGWEVLPP